MEFFPIGYEGREDIVPKIKDFPKLSLYPKSDNNRF
jgi:hypothetical protein